LKQLQTNLFNFQSAIYYNKLLKQNSLVNVITRLYSNLAGRLRISNHHARILSPKAIICCCCTGFY